MPMGRGPRREAESLLLCPRMLQTGLEERDALPLMGTRCREWGRGGDKRPPLREGAPEAKPTSLPAKDECGERRGFVTGSWEGARAADPLPSPLGSAGLSPAPIPAPFPGPCRLLSPDVS